MASGVAKMVIFRGAPLSRFGIFTSRNFSASSVSSAVSKSDAVSTQPTGELVPAKQPDGKVSIIGDEQSGVDPIPMVPSGEALIHEGPERDLVNFPRPTMPLYPGRTRMGMFPEEWFDFFYKKTGVTGPYVFGTGLITFLLSKEFWVVEHNWPSIPVLIAIFYIGMTKLGPKLAAALDKNIDTEEEGMIAFQEDNIKNVQGQIQTEEKNQWMAKGQSMLFEAKRENVRMQLETEYRRRLSEVYKEVKRRLDYQIEIQNARRGVERRHMVNWIVNNVMKSIDEKQEKQNIDQCIANLQKLSGAIAK